MDRQHRQKQALRSLELIEYCRQLCRDSQAIRAEAAKARKEANERVAQLRALIDLAENTELVAPKGRISRKAPFGQSLCESRDLPRDRLLRVARSRIGVVSEIGETGMDVLFELPRYPFKRSVIEVAPNEPGIYALFDGSEPVYLGRANSLKEELLQLFDDGLVSATAYTWEITVATRNEAREAEALASFRVVYGREPRHNRAG